MALFDLQRQSHIVEQSPASSASERNLLNTIIVLNIRATYPVHIFSFFLQMIQEGHLLVTVHEVNSLTTRDENS